MIARVSVILSSALTVDWNAGMERRPMTDRGCAPSVNITGPRSRGRAISITVMHCTFQTRVGVPARVPVLSIRSRSAALGLRAPVDPSLLTERHRSPAPRAKTESGRPDHMSGEIYT